MHSMKPVRTLMKSASEARSKKPLKKPLKIRKNIMLSKWAVAQGKELAAREHRNFSNMLEVLVVREHARIDL